MDKVKFEQYWHRLRQVWPAYKNENDAVKRNIYYRRLRRYKDEAVEQAIGRHLDAGKRFPQIADLIELLPNDSTVLADRTGMASMNDVIAVKVVEMHHKGWTYHRVTWIADKTGSVSGYKLDFWKFDEQGARVDFGIISPVIANPVGEEGVPFES